MGGIAVLAKQAGFAVTGSDTNVYPPMSTTLENAGIKIIEGFDEKQLTDDIDLVVVGNVMKRGMPIIEKMLNEGIPFVSGPQWLEEHYLKDKCVFAVAGTHGKTTTTSMLAHILDYNHKNPGFLVGGIPENFKVSARNTDSKYFVIEADEYDCAFFDKRSKFLHYHPTVQILNNLEFDHADIFDSIKDIKKQFHHLVRTIPSKGLIVCNSFDQNLKDTLDMGCWTPVAMVGDEKDLHAVLTKADGEEFDVFCDKTFICHAKMAITGTYNVQNALMAVKAASYADISIADSFKALESFIMPKRRMELKGQVGNIKVYDDFAHHPTAIKLTIEGLRAKIGDTTDLVAVFEPRSNSMKMGANKEFLGASFASANEVFIYVNDKVSWDVSSIAKDCPVKVNIFSDINKLVEALCQRAKGDTNFLIMSNGSFLDLHQKLLKSLNVN